MIIANVTAKKKNSKRKERNNSLNGNNENISRG
jgi:hypothetical protein